MTEGLDAIYDELRRLQKEGVGHVFVEDTTQSLLTTNSGASASLKRGEPVEHESLAELIKKPAAPAPVKEIAKAQAAVATLPDLPAIEIPDVESNQQLEWLKERVLACETCKQQKKDEEKLVFGEGAHDADILFCGDAPGTDEARSGVPFAGDAGELLNKIIKAMGLNRSKVYCTYLVKWRPKNDKPYGNRPPNSEELRFCLPYFRAEVDIVRPKVIVALGQNTVNGLFGFKPERKLGQIRGTWDVFQDTPTLITFCPSYLLRNDSMKTKRLVWEDLLSAIEKVGLPISDKQRGFFLPK